MPSQCKDTEHLSGLSVERGNYNSAKGEAVLVRNGLFPGSKKWEYLDL